jgi:pimeloyl-ACP methyl ester carboxylesterase
MRDRLSISHKPPSGRMEDAGRPVADYVEAGEGPFTLLIHSSMSGARQWSSLMTGLADHLTLRAVNLFGYGDTPNWNTKSPPSIADFAQLAADVVPPDANRIRVVGHSLGGAVAMHAAAFQLQGRVDQLVLVEPSVFGLLEVSGQRRALQEITMIAIATRQHLADGDPETAAELFIDYWCGEGTFAASSARRRDGFVEAVSGLPYEWNAVFGSRLTASSWAERLPRRTLLLCASETGFASKEIVRLLADAAPHWTQAEISEAGHMAPLTHPHIVNPMIADFLLGGQVAADTRT